MSDYQNPIEMLALEMRDRMAAAAALANSYAATNETQRRRIDDLLAKLAAANARAEAAEAQLALVERYGADQWRRGNSGKEPQELHEWQRFHRVNGITTPTAPVGGTAPRPRPA